MKIWKNGMLALLVAAPLFGTVSAGNDITVRLSNTFGNYKTNTTFKVDNSYRITNDTDVVQKGITYTVKVEGDKIALYNGSEQIAIDNPLRLVPSGSANSLTLGSQRYLGEMHFELENGYIRPFNKLDLEDYLKGVVPKEMLGSWATAKGLEAYKTQAVAARSYAYSGWFINSETRTIQDTTSDQVYGGFVNNAIGNQAVDATEGEVLFFNGEGVTAYYSSSNGGYSESNEAVWSGSPLGYLPAKKDSYDPVRTFSTEKTHAEMVALLQPKTTLGIQSITSIKIIEKTSGQRAKTIQFNIITKEGKAASFTMKGTDFRALVGNSVLKSTYLNQPVYKNGEFTFSGQGYGHGVGMSQFGAYNMSEKGIGYRTILQHYYPGTTIYNFVKAKLVSASATNSQNVLTLDYETDKDSKVLVDIRTLSGSPVMFIEPYVLKEAGTHQIQADISHLRGTYKARIIVMKKDTGEVTDSYMKNIYLQPSLPAFSKGFQTTTVSKKTPVYADLHKTIKADELQASELVKVIAGYGTVYEISYDGKTLFVDQSALTKTKEKDVRVTVNGYQLNMDEKPKTKSNRVLIPMRFVSNGLGMQVQSWNNKTKTAIISKQGKTISLTLGKKVAIVDGKLTQLDMSIQSYNGRLFIPLRFVSEQMGAYVNWDSSNNTVWVKQN